MRTLTIFLLLITAAAAQETVAPTPEMADTSRGQDWQGYNVVNSFELGYRFAAVGGNLAQYQSMVNYHDGVRLLSSYLTLNSKDGHGHYFDELVLTTQGLGNDPYENAILRISKNGLYRYDMSWRRNDYVNPGLTTGGGANQHVLDTQYDLQDHDLTLFPQASLKFFLGFTGSSQTGPSLTSVQLFDDRGSIYPLFADTRRLRREYRLGNEFRLFGIRVNWLHGWDDFKEDTPVSLANAGVPLPISPGAPLNSFRRTEPYHGTSPYWRVMLFRDTKTLSMNGRFTYTSGQRAFALNDSAIGPGRIGVQNQQILVQGDAQRPVATGNLTLSWLPSSKLNVVNSTAVYNVRTEGNSAYVQFNNATQAANLAFFQYLGVLTASNETDANYQMNNWFGLSAGYQYSARRIRSVEQATFFGTTDTTPGQQTNHLNVGTLSARLRPYKGLSIWLAGEIGTNDHPFTPVAGKNYHALNARIQYKYKNFMLSGTSQSDYRFTPASLSAFSSEARTYAVNASWNPVSWIGFDAGYSKLHLYSLGGIAYFASLQLVQGESSLYLSNIHSVNLSARFEIRKIADFFVGYSRVQDTAATPQGATANPAFKAAETLPMAYDSPQARLSFRLRERLRWNIGYQYYGYREKFYPAENFRANTGYSSVTWSF